MRGRLPFDFVRMPALRWALLAASALFNVVLFVQRASPASNRAAADTAARFEPSGVASSGGYRLADSESYRDASRSSAECQNAVVPLESEVNALSMELRRRLPMPRLFALGEPNADAEQTFRPLIEGILAEALASEPATSDRTPLPYTLECRDIICQLTFIANATAPAMVGTALSTNVELRRRVTALSFPQSHSTEDVLTKTKVNEAKVYWRVVEPDGDPPRQ
jgi:hypothetical protein